MEFVKVEGGMQIGQPLVIVGGSTNTGKSMINTIVEESRLVNARPTTSAFEHDVLCDIVEYIMNTPSTRGMDMRDAIKQYWNERLN
jgi:hypothetical protein